MRLGGDVLVKKIVSVKGVARFEDLAAEANVDFKPLTLIYGDNGSGKTTLAAVFRSSGQDNPHTSTSEPLSAVPTHPRSRCSLKVRGSRRLLPVPGKGGTQRDPGHCGT
jgi:hypothetical protein